MLPQGKKARLQQWRQRNRSRSMFKVALVVLIVWATSICAQEVRTITSYLSFSCAQIFTRRHVLGASGVLASWIFAAPAFPANPDPGPLTSSTSLKLNPVGSRGLRIGDFREGKGAVAQDGNTVRIQWSGRLFSKQGWTYGRCSEDCELRFKIGDGSTIEGLDEGIRGMQEGGLRRLMIPSAMAYQEGKELQPLPEDEGMKRRLYNTVFNTVRRDVNGEDTVGTIVLDISLKRVRS
eukprot:TRINITY_DN32288_c0_g1_i1.p1 TRINITY_DN32288_c0_g1~~TRINITY_DN32288_c0_g1_i1.p1  ORF type:complete len:236 (+),score=20.36 TRINITY_DN32288_c0_g1_i1:101-808(+)